MLVIELRVTPNPVDICQGHDPVKAITDCISCFIVRRNTHSSSVGMLYPDQVEPPSVVQTKVAARKFRKMSRIWLLDLWI